MLPPTQSTNKPALLQDNGSKRGRVLGKFTDSRGDKNNGIGGLAAFSPSCLPICLSALRTFLPALPSLFFFVAHWSHFAEAHVWVDGFPRYCTFPNSKTRCGASRPIQCSLRLYSGCSLRAVTLNALCAL